MQISHQDIIFAQKQSKTQIFLTNNSDSILIFKIKTNDIYRLKAVPSRGFMNQKQTMTVTIQSTFKQAQFEAKLQLIWAFINQKQSSFEDTWKKINPNSFTQNVIPMSRKAKLSEIKEQSNGKHHENEQEDSISMKSSVMSDCQNPFDDKSSQHASQMVETKVNNQKMLKSVTSPLVRMNSIKEKQKKQNEKYRKPQVKDIRITQTMVIKRQQKSTTNSTYQQPQNHQSRASNQSKNSNYLPPSQASSRQVSQPNLNQYMGIDELSRLCFVQSQLLAERQQSSRLKQELRKNKQLQNERNQMMRQYNINRSMTQQCDHSSIQWSTIVVLAAIFFTIGLLMSRF